MKLQNMAQTLRLSQELDTEAGAETLVLEQHGEVVTLERLNKSGKTERMTAIGPQGEVTTA